MADTTLLIRILRRPPVRRCSPHTIAGQIVVILLMLFTMSPSPAGAVAAQSDEGLTGDQRYESPQFGYETTWDDPWTVDEGALRSRTDREDRLVLINEDNDAELTIRGVFTNDSARDVVDEVITDREDDEEDVIVEDQSRRSALISYTNRDGDVVEYVEVSGLDTGESLLIVDLVAPAGDFADAVDALQSVELDGASALQDEPAAPQSVDAADPTETPTDEGTVRRRPSFATDEPTEEPTEDADDDEADGVDGNTFTSPNFDFSLSWDEDVWTVDETNLDEDEGDQISLNTRDSFVVFQASRDFGGDVDDCLSSITGFLADGNDDLQIEDVDVLDDEDGDPIEDSSRDRAYVANLYTATFEGDEEQFVYYVECRTLVEDESELVVFHFVQNPDDYVDEAEARDEIVDSLETGEGSPRGDDPTATPDDDEPTATPDDDEETPETGDETTFESDAFGFSLSYDSSLWEETGSGDDGIALDDGPSSLTIAAAEEFDGDSVACVQGQLDEIRGFEGVTRVDAETGTNGRRISGGDSERFYALYRVTASDGSFEGTNELLVYLECRTLAENDSVITILHLVFDPDQYEQEAARAEAVLETIEVEG